MNNKIIVFLGSRYNVLEQLIACESLVNLKIYALKGSLLETILIDNGIPHDVFSLEKKKDFLKMLIDIEFDILISNGCPIIFPVERFKKHQILINIHPTYLPYLQGKTPLNGVFYAHYDFYGATMHYIDKGIDTGDIIYQKKQKLTKDIDLGLLYHLAMKLEGVVFKQGWNKLKASNFKNIGRKQKGNPSYFNRTEVMQTIDFNSHNTDQILLTIKSFGIETQGSFCSIDNKKYKIIAAEKILHKPLLDMYANCLPGKIVLTYDTKMLIKTIDGLIKVTRFFRL
ncbi:hypothetical protein APS56_02215 [Pseudalgibacter alginicilyticus]|uniref:Formyl transferase N-terminal domain-containing protein n=1 Tax=Pseudalgibacter alginicilyticus TaxID=1736674 RepID=A0A0P0CDE5_9FLAO|nr:formyltransferase family protein [Pseudalgibacter alginicilyticus]ALJ04041.1 hypothetical protein APS56_02215 [Pseudalgibacter alginicilyticus]